MSNARLGIAAGNRLGVDAAANVSKAGGNAVDACLASAIMGWVAEPFYTSVAGSGFIAVRTPEGTVEIIDGNVSMPQTIPAEPGQGLRRIYLQYSNGMYTGIGGGAVAVPGVVAAARLAWERHGNIEWEALFQDAITAARDGIDFPRSSAYYLSETWERIWSEYPDSSALFGRDNRPMKEGELLVQAELAEALEVIAQKGPDSFYRGELGDEIVTAIAKDGGFLSPDDLDGYLPEVREPIEREAFEWRIESNPPPAVGGAVMSHMLALLDAVDMTDEDARLDAFVDAQSAAMGYRQEAYQEPGDVAGALEEVMTRLGHQPRRRGETTHSSSAGSDGYVCSISESNGYGAGLVVHGMLLNNTLGEEELNPMGVHRLVPGSRCHSNMTPTIATGPDRIVGLGSPGADRIVGAIVQTLIRLAIDGESLGDAVGAPRAHLDARPEGSLLCYEPGLEPNPRDAIPRPYDDIHMYFGAVQAASVTPDGKVDAAHDPRRSGASALV